MDLGRLAISLPVPFFSARECVDLGRRAESEWGYQAIWLAETSGPDSFALAGALAVTEAIKALRAGSLTVAPIQSYVGKSPL